MSDRKWYETHDNVLGLASWLDNECWFRNTSDMLYYFEKPWKWTREYGLWQLWQKHCGENEDRANQCIEAIGEDTTAEGIQAQWEEAAL